MPSARRTARTNETAAATRRVSFRTLCTWDFRGLLPAVVRIVVAAFEATLRLNAAKLTRTWWLIGTFSPGISEGGSCHDTPPAMARAGAFCLRFFQCIAHEKGTNADATRPPQFADWLEEEAKELYKLYKDYRLSFWTGLDVGANG